MSKCYHAEVDAVDGERVYVIFTPDPIEVLAFLAQHDHEGSNTWVYAGEEEEYQGEEAYRFLERQI